MTTSRRTGAALALGALLVPLAWSPPASASATANEVVFTQDTDLDGRYEVVLRDLETRTSRVLLGQPADPDEVFVYDDPDLSADGRQVALSTDRAAPEQFQEGIAVVDVATGALRRLTNPTQGDATYQLDVAPAWSPDGSRIVFTRLTADAVAQTITDTQLLTVTTGASPAVTPVAGGEDGYTADYSPDGSRIVFAELTNPATQDSGPLVVVNAAGGGRTALGVTGLLPAWSPDGTAIAYATVTARDADRERANDSVQIAVVPSGGGAERRLTRTQPDPARPTVAEYPAWLPDSRSILFDLFGYTADDSFPPGDLWAVDRDGNRAGPVLLAPGDEAQASVQGPAPAGVVAGTAARFVPVAPTRVLDTRSGPGNVGAPAGKVGPGGTVDLQVRGVGTPDGDVPSSATAVVLNVTVVNTTAPTDVRVYPTPTDGSVPRASNLNVTPGNAVPNLVTAAIGSDGSVRLRNAAGSADLIADLAGYYDPQNGTLGFTPVDPGRVLDTRPASATGAPAGKVGPGGTLDLRVTGALRTADGRTVTVPEDAEAVVLNVTATGATLDTDVRVYPRSLDDADAVPTVSNLNLRRGQTVANLVTVQLQDAQTQGQGREVRLRNASGQVDLIADIAGYYSAGSSGRFVPVAPLRFLDTRSGVGAAPVATGAGQVLDVAFAGTRGLPAGATAVVLNLTATAVTESTDVRAFPTGAAEVPRVSNLNPQRGVTRANAVVVRTGSAGQVRLRNAAGEVALLADLAGYFTG